MTEEKKPDRKQPNWSGLAAVGVLIFLRGFALMLALGALHNDWTVNVPALGFWACLAVSAALSSGLKPR
jgi:hypothetical protein